MSVVFHRWLMAGVLAFSMLLPLIANSGTAFACSCVAPPSLETQIESATVAFVGKVESVEPSGELDIRVEFEVDEFWKGAPTERVVVYTANNSAACGVSFEEGTEYFVLASGTQRLETGLCVFSVNMDDGSDADLEAIEALGEGQEPDDDDPPPQGNGDGDEPTDDGDGSGGSGDTPSDGDGAAGETGDSTSDVDPDPLNVSAVVLAALVAAGAVVVVAGRR